MLTLLRCLRGSWLQPLLVFSAMALLYAWRLQRRWLPGRRLQGQVVVVTGASSGLGEALAHHLYAAGCRLILMSRDMERLARVREDVMLYHQGEAVYPPAVVPLDLADCAAASAAGRRALAVYGHVDVLICNAGVSYRGEAAETSLAVDQQLMQVNYLGQVALLKTVVPSMRLRRRGHLLCVSSVQGRIAIPYRSAYAASKHALQAFCDCLRAELAGDAVQVTVVSPSYIATSLSKNALTATGATYSRMDDTTAAGMPASAAASRVVAALLARHQEALLAPLKDRLAVVVRAVWPELFFYLMRLRAASGTGRPQ